jgi:DNA mismatch repair protein MutL
MRAAIRILPDDLVARIAAGEVIERPASVVKELVENALDAGARHVHVEVQHAGFGLVRVRDNGLGIPPGELWLACQRHTTSKLLEDDLTHIRTLGFRGEALPSIAAVAELELASAVDQSGVGRRIVVRGGRLLLDEPAPHPRGTTATVRHLFEDVPARLAAARSAAPETAQIVQTVRRLALSAPHVASSLVVDGRLVLRTSGSKDLEVALVEAYGPALAGRLVRLEPAEVAGARISGFVGSPEVTRPHRTDLHLITNGRWAQVRGLLHALESAYRTLLPRGRHPILALVIQTSPDLVDVNVHPAKLEVRLVHEHAIGQVAAELVRAALGRRPQPVAFLVPPLPFERPEAAVAEEAEAWGEEEGPILTSAFPPLQLVGQAQGRLIVLEGPDGLYLIDQHRAHERVLYEHLRSAHKTRPVEPFRLPDPLVVELRPGQVESFRRRLPELEALGFRCEEFGGCAFLVREAPYLPGVLGGGEVPEGLGDLEALARILAEAAEDEVEGWRERLEVALACRLSVRRGRALDRRAMRALVEALGQTQTPAVCPHGAPAVLHVAGSLLEHQFRWR